MEEHSVRARHALGAFLRERREAMKLTREHLADQLRTQDVELSPSTLARIESGDTALVLEHAGALGLCLGVTVSTMQEVLRSARVREVVDLTAWTFDGLLEEGKRRVSHGDFHGALRHFQALHGWVALHPDAASKPDLVARALVYEANCHLSLRNYEHAQSQNGRALQLAGVSADAKLSAILTEIMIRTFTREFLKAEAFVVIAEPLLPTAALRTRAYGHAVVAGLAWHQDQYERAIPRVEQARDAYREIGADVEVLRCNIKLGFCLHKTGYPEGGLRLASEALAAARGGRFREVEAFGCRLLALIQVDQGNGDAALDLLTEARSLARSLDLPHEEFLALWYQLPLYIERGIRAEIGRCVKRMQTLLPFADQHAPAVQEFVLRHGRGLNTTEEGQP